MNREFNLMMGKDHVRLSFGNVEKWKLNDMRDVFITLLGIGIPYVFSFFILHLLELLDCFGFILPSGLEMSLP